MSSKKMGLTKDALASWSKLDSLSESQLQQTQGGKWKTIATVVPGWYQYNTRHTWIQAQGNLSYTFQVVANGWVSQAASGYIIP